MKDKTIAIWFSCGAASAVAVKKTIQDYGNKNEILVINNPVKEEHEDNLRFKYDIEKQFGIKIIEAKNPKYPNASIFDVFRDRKYISGIHGAPCTLELKKKVRYEFEKNNKIDFHVLGFTIDEWKRQYNFNKAERSNTLPVLISNLITKEDCLMF